MLLAFERAERETDPTRRQALLTFVVVGGGPTGVELAGALAEIARQSLARDFRHFDPGSARIILLEAGPVSCSRRFPSRSARPRATISSVSASTCARARRSRGSVRRAWIPQCVRDRGGHDPVGGGRRRVAARRDARRADGSRRPRAREARSDDSRTSGGLRHRRPRVAQRTGRQALSRRRAGRDADGRARGAEHPARDRRTADAAVRVSRSRQHGDDRPRRGGRRLRLVAGCTD